MQAGRWPANFLAGILLLVCLILMSLPFDGLSAARLLAGFTPGFSLPFTALLLHATLRRLGGPGVFRPAELAPCGGGVTGGTGRGWLYHTGRAAVWRFGALAGLALYPAALGLGRWDPYASGWQFSALFVVVAVVAAFLLGRGHRLGWVLLVAIAAWQLQVLESTNYWDYLVDPVYFLISVPLALLGLRSGGCVPREISGAETLEPAANIISRGMHPVEPAPGDVADHSERCGRAFAAP